MGEIRKCLCCGLVLKRGKIMCDRDWRLVPAELRHAVRRTWREYRRAPFGQPAIVALGIYDTALRQAVDAAMSSRREAA